MLSFNVFTYSHEYQRLVQFIGEQSPDVLILMEVTPAWAQALDGLAAQYAFRLGQSGRRCIWHRGAESPRAAPESG